MSLKRGRASVGRITSSHTKDSSVMTITYRQLTLAQRYQIETLLAAGLHQAAIARQLRCHRSTINRELARCPSRVYRARQAQKASDRRRRLAAKSTRYNALLWNRIGRCLKRSLSPEMIAHRMRLEKVPDAVSTSTIYRWLRWDWRQGGDWYQYLQRAYQPYRRRYGSRSWYRRYDHHRTIHERPLVAAKRSRCGDWEGDTMYGKKGHLVTLVDRCSRYLVIRKVAERTKAEATRSVVNMLKRQPAYTLTLDNGVEFSDHKIIEKRARIKVYFADAYASWQRGSNENANGRLRRFIPRSTDLSQLSAQKLRRIVEQMNHQPRKCLGWLSPYEVYNSVSVALIV